MRTYILTLLMALMILGCQSEETFTGKVKSVGVGKNVLTVSVFQGDVLDNKHKRVQLIMVKLPGTKQQQTEFGREVFNLAKENHYKATLKMIDSPEGGRFVGSRIRLYEQPRHRHPVIEKGLSESGQKFGVFFGLSG